MSINTLNVNIKPKTIGYLIVLVGLALLLLGLADLTYYVFFPEYLTSDPLVVTGMYLSMDIVCVVSAAISWLIGSKLLRAKA